MMNGNVIPVSEGTTIIVKASGDLFLQGDSQMEIRFQSSEDRVRVNQSKETIYVETHASLDLVVPASLPIIVEKTGGSAFLQDLESTVVIQKIGGDLTLRRIGSLRLEKVGGSCMIEDATQPVTIHKVGGDLTLRSVETPLQIGSIGGTGDLQLLGGGPLEARAGGDLHIYLLETIGGPITLRAGSDVEVFLPPSINANFVLDSSGESIDIELNRQAMPNIQNLESRHYEFSLGEGGPLCEIRAGADIRVTDAETEPESISDEFDQRERAWKEAQEHYVQPSWSGGFGFDRNSAWADMVSRRAQEASRRAEHRVHTAMRRTEDHIRQAAERDMHMAEMRYGGAPVPPPPPPPPKISEQERLLVLQMLKDNKITVEQAEKLLAALEGR